MNRFDKNLNLESISKLFPYELIELQKGELIYTANNPNSYIYFILDGSVKIINDGWTLGIIHEQEFVGMISFLNEKDTYRFSAITIENSILYKITREDFKNVLLKNREFSSQVIQMLCNRNRLIDTKIVKFFNCTPKCRLINELLSHSRKSKNSILIFLGKKELSELIGIEDIEVEKILTELTLDEVIATDHSDCIKVLDYGKLFHLSDTHKCSVTAHRF